MISQKHPFLGFTLVELVVVITILALLSAIGFLSYTNHIESSRDANRITQARDIYSGLQLYATNKKLPFPQEYITITASGEVLWYQGYAGEDILEDIKYKNGGIDPKDEDYFTYYISKERKKIQILTFLESQENLISHALLPQAQADLTQRYPKNFGNELGIILEQSTNTPINRVSSWTLDVVLSGNTYKVSLSDNNLLTGSGTSLAYLRKYSSCERINQVGEGNTDGFYTLSPRWVDIRVYCKMSRLYKNMLSVNWSLGSGNTGDFVINGTVAENQRISYTTPFGDTDVVWQAVPEGVSGADGGWNYSNIPIDSEKTYRLSVWIKKTGTVDGSTYLGTLNVNNLNGTLNGNPYFFAADLPQLDIWYLVVGYIHKSSYSSLTSYGWIYDKITGQKLVGITDFKNVPWNTISRHRAYLFYNTDITNRQYFYAPRFEEIEESDIGDVKDLLSPWY